MSRKTILLAGPSAGGKSTLARALAAFDRRYVVSTSSYLKSQVPDERPDPQVLYMVGQNLDTQSPGWVRSLIQGRESKPCVIDAIRSANQAGGFSGSEVIQVNVECPMSELARRHQARGTKLIPVPYMFPTPDFTWDSSRMSLSLAVQAIEQLAGSGHVDLLVGGQYGSEGKGKLAALLATEYDILVRSGGPNAGHWVRDENYEFCFHHLPSGTLANKDAIVGIAAGATLNPDTFLEEVERTGCANRLRIDHNAFLITRDDITREHGLVGKVGSTAQGVGMAAARRILRGLDQEPTPVSADSRFHGYVHSLAHLLGRQLNDGARVMLEGTQGSGLSIYHGPYPYTTSRDTNTPGLLSEVGIAPPWVRDVWMVVRSLPIRVGGNSGPMDSETSWEEVAQSTGKDPLLLKSRERTSTTNRQRRVANFDWVQFEQATRLNRPTKIFLTFADYLDPTLEGSHSWSAVGQPLRSFIQRLESDSGAMVAGISTGRRQSDVIWRDR